MKTITVPKATLLEKLRENRGQHRQTFEEAWQGYRKHAERDLAERLDAVRDGKPFNLKFGLVVPQDHTDDYDTAINMLEWHVGDEMEVSQEEFRQYVEDDWGWKDQFLHSTASYLHD